MLQWAKQTVAHGYVAFLVDYMSPRDVDSAWYGPKKALNFSRGAKDTFEAAQYLRKFDVVDKQRIGLAGFRGDDGGGAGGGRENQIQGGLSIARGGQGREST